MTLAFLILLAMTTEPLQLGYSGFGQSPAVHHCYSQARAAVVGRVVTSETDVGRERRDAPGHSQRFRLAIERVVRGAWTDDEVDLEVWRYVPDLDLAVGEQVFCLLDRDRSGRPILLGSTLPTIVTGNRQVLAYQVAFREFDELWHLHGTDRRRALVDWMVTCCEREPTRHLGLHDLRHGSFSRNSRSVSAQLTPEHQQRLVALLASGELSIIEESVLLRAIEDPWVPSLQETLAATLRQMPVSEADRPWSSRDVGLLILRLDVLARQRSLAGQDPRRWPDRKRELHDALGGDYWLAPAALADPTAARRIVLEVLGGAD